MADMQQLERALINADAAGDTAAAQTLAAEIRRVRGASEAPKPIDPTEGMSTTDKVLAGVGKGMTDIGRGIGQRLGLVSQQEIDEARKIDAPLMKTGAGRLGNFSAKIAPAIGAMMLPGGQTLAGSMAANATLGAIEPTATGESALKNTLVGGASAGIGFGAGKLVGMGVNKLAARSATQAAAREGTKAVATTARQSGYVLPPSSTNPNILNTMLEGAAGKISTAQKASIKNQTVTNAIAAKELGLDPLRPITKEALDGIRSKAFTEGYMPVRAAGTLKADDAFLSQLDDIAATHTGASRSFPGLAKDEVPELLASLRQPQFDAGDAIDAVRLLRDTADEAFRQGKGALGKASKDASRALEDVIERGLASGGDDSAQALQAYREARQLIAKTHTVEKALDQSTGNLNAKVFKAQMEKGKPLSGGLRDIAKTAQAFPKAVETPKSSMLGVSPLDLYASAGLGAAGSLMDKPWLAALPLARIGARSAILSGPYQSAMGAAGPGLLGRIGNNPEQVTGLLSQGGGLLGMATPGLLDFK